MTFSNMILDADEDIRISEDDIEWLCELDNPKVGTIMRKDFVNLPGDTMHCSCGVYLLRGLEN